MKKLVKESLGDKLKGPSEESIMNKLVHSNMLASRALELAAENLGLEMFKKVYEKLKGKISSQESLDEAVLTAWKFKNDEVYEYLVDELGANENPIVTAAEEGNMRDIENYYKFYTQLFKVSAKRIYKKALENKNEQLALFIIDKFLPWAQKSSFNKYSALEMTAKSFFGTKVLNFLLKRIKKDLSPYDLRKALDYAKTPRAEYIIRKHLDEIE